MRCAKKEDIIMSKFAIIGDSTCDLTPELRKSNDIDYAKSKIGRASCRERV